MLAYRPFAVAILLLVLATTLFAGTATYDAGLNSPSCPDSSSPCIAPATLLKSKDTLSTAEPNQPNTIGSACSDDSGGGTYGVGEESIENLTITDLSGSTFYGGDSVQVVVQYLTNGAGDNVDLFYTNSTSSVSWQLIGTDTIGASGNFTSTFSFPLDNTGGEHAVRAQIRYNGAANPCDNSGFSDHDDVAFQVNLDPPIGACGEITAPGLYTLTANLTGAPNSVSGVGAVSNSCINISADNVTLDCDGKFINNTNIAQAAAIVVKDSDNVTIKNCNIYDYQYGLYLYGTSIKYNSMFIENNTIIANYSIGTPTYGIYGNYLEGSRFEDNYIADASYGVYDFSYTAGASNVHNRNNVSHTKTIGYNLVSLNVTFENNTASGGAGTGLFTTNDYASISYNDIYGYSNRGVYIGLFLAPSGYALNNTIHGNNIGLSGSGHVVMNYTHFYNNTVDINFKIDGLSTANVNMTDTTLDNPLGNYVNETVLNIDDYIYPNGFDSFDFEELNYTWTGGDSVPSLPGTETSFHNKYINITRYIYFQYGSTDTDYIDDVRFKWTDDEVLGYYESTIQLWENDGTWSNTGATPNEGGNYIAYSHFRPGSTFAVTADLVEPVYITINLPDNITYAINNTIPLYFTYTGTPDACWYSINGGSNTTLVDCDNTTIPSAGELADGPYNVTVYANDSIGTVSSDSENFTVDATDPIRIFTCQQITEDNYTYLLNNSLTGAPIPEPDFPGIDYTCILIKAENVTLDCDGKSITNTDVENASAISVASSSSSSRYKNVNLKDCPSLSLYDYGITLRNTENAAVLNSTIHDNNVTGIYNRDGLNTDINTTVVKDHDMYGIRIAGDTADTEISDVLVYNNHPTNDVYSTSITQDIIGENFVTGELVVSFHNVTFDNPSGGLDRYTTIYAGLNISQDESFTLGWSDAPSLELPEGYLSVDDKYLFSQYSGTSPFSYLSFSWYVPDLSPGHIESRFELWDGESPSWTLVNNTPDTGADRITAFQSNIDGSPLALLENASLTSCAEIDTSGTYILVGDIEQGAPTDVTGTGRINSTCLLINADDVTIECDGYTLRNADNSSNSSGIYIGGVERFTYRNCNIEDYPNGVIDEGAVASTHYGPGSSILAGTAAAAGAGIIIASSGNSSTNGTEPMYICGFETGVLVEDSVNSVFTDVIVCNNTKYGFRIVDSDNTTIQGISRAYNNSVDFRVENNLGSPVALDLDSLTFDNPLGNLMYHTELYLTDSVAAGTAYNISWTSEPATPPGNLTSFEGKYIDISGTGPIDSISWHWTDEESVYRGYDENLLLLSEYVSSYTILTSAVLDIVANTLSYANLNPSSQYGILYNGSIGTYISLYGANVSNVTDYRWQGESAGNRSIEGGNISDADISSTSLTDRWAAYFGNVSGSLMLTDDPTSNYVYQWAWSSADGAALCLSTNSSLTSFLAIAATGSDIDSAWSFPASALDSGTNTFNWSNCTLDIGGTNISNSSYVDSGHTGGFHTCAIKSASTPTKPQMLFCTNVIQNGLTYNNTYADFEVMVPTAYGPTATETYYFYLNLG